MQKRCVFFLNYYYLIRIVDLFFKALFRDRCLKSLCFEFSLLHINIPSTHTCITAYLLLKHMLFNST